MIAPSVTSRNHPGQLTKTPTTATTPATTRAADARAPHRESKNMDPVSTSRQITSRTVRHTPELHRGHKRSRRPKTCF